MKKHEFNINEKVNPLLSNVWGQWYPFNTHCPSNVFPFFAKNKNNAPTGCVAMALAQIMAFHEFPQKIEITDFDWQKIKQIMPCENPNFFGEKKYINALTKFLAEIGKKCLNIYAHNWTFALPQMAKRCLKYFGYQNVTLTYG
ncbi:MAG: C10 family peptidase, partial [Prevotellaceae bacterium]|nr:C10 family peptidase [Prevotellaceae bacterium]